LLLASHPRGICYSFLVCRLHNPFETQKDFVSQYHIFCHISEPPSEWAFSDFCPLIFYYIFSGAENKAKAISEDRSRHPGLKKSVKKVRRSK
jgi:hypothetical protein